MTQCHHAYYFIIDDDDIFGSSEALMDEQVWLQHVPYESLGSLPIYTVH